MKDKTFGYFLFTMAIVLLGIAILTSFKFQHNYFPPARPSFTVGIYNGTHIIDYIIDCQDGRVIDVRPSVNAFDIRPVLQDPRPVSLKWEILNWGSC